MFHDVHQDFIWQIFEDRSGTLDNLIAYCESRVSNSPAMRCGDLHEIDVLCSGGVVGDDCNGFDVIIRVLSHERR